MSVTNFPNGISSFGVPLYGMSGMPIPSHLGKVFFVHSGNGAVVNDGLATDKALASIDSAVGKCSAGAGDVIMVLAGHTESVTAAGGIDLDVAGISVIGQGSGNNRPTVTFTTINTADIDIDAANVTLSNIRFVTDVDSLAAPIDVNAAGFTMTHCDFYGNGGAAETNLITVLTDAAAKRMKIQNCSFNYDAALDGTNITTTSTACIQLVGADHAEILDNYISGDFTTSAINGITTASKDIKILRNAIYNDATENIAGVIDLVAACTGIIAFNYGFMGYATGLATVIDPASCGMVQNYFSNVVTETGGLVGTAST